MSKSDTIFVFYKTTNYLNLKKIPSHLEWIWIGSGGTGDKDYPSEMQFMGKKNKYDEMYSYLDNIFLKLKEKGIIESYHFSDTYIYHNVDI
jgi:transposase